MRKGLVSAAFCSVALVFGAAASVWTGGGNDDKWVNADNWDGGIPGVYVDGNGVTITNSLTAVFNATGAARRTIDLENLVGVKYIEIEPGADPYTFGTSDAQKLGINHDGAILVKAGAHCPTIAATLLKIANAEYGYWSMPAGRQRPGFAITNLSSEVFTINKFSGYAGLVNSGETALWLCGTGDFKFTSSADSTGGSMHIFHRSAGKVTIDACTLKVREWLCDQVHPAGSDNFRELEITAGGGLGASTIPYGMLVLSYKYRIYGEGSLLFSDGRQVASAAQITQYAALGLYNRWVDTRNDVNADVEISCKCEKQDVTKWGRPAGYETGMPFSGWYGNVKMLGDASAIKGEVSLYAAKYIVDELGMKADSPHTGSGDFIMTYNARIEYTGSGDTTDRGITITNGYPAVSTDVGNNMKMNGSTPYRIYSPATAYVIQNGTGVLHMQGQVNAAVTNSLLALYAYNTSPEARWESVLADNPCGAEGLYCALSIAKRDSGTWRLTAANTFSGSVSVEGGTLVIDDGASIDNASSLKMAGGTLEIAGSSAATAFALPETTVTGTSKLKVGANRTVTLAGLAQSGSGKLDVVTASCTAKLVVTGLAEGDAPAWLTVNGFPAKYSAADGLYTDAYSTWKTAANGKWTDSEKWTPEGVPAADRPVMLMDNQGAYTVTIDANRAISTNLTVGTAESAGSADTATLAVDGAEVAVAGSKLTLQGNGRVSLANGAKVVYDNHEIVPYNFKDNILKIENGGELTVGAGCTLSFTNFHGQVVIGGTETNNTGKLTVDGGAMQFFTYPRTGPSAPKNNESLISVNKGGTLEFKGDATFDFGNGAATDFYGVLHNKDGKVIYGGNTLARLWCVNYLGKEGSTANADLVNGVHYALGGETLFKDNARIDIIHTSTMDTTFAVVPIYGSYPTSTVTFIDHAGFSSTRGATKRAQFRVAGGGMAAGAGILNLFSDRNHNSDAPSQPTVGHSISVGDVVGLGVLNITNGSIFAGSCSFQVGKGDGNPGCRGVMNVSGKGKVGLYGTGSVSPAWTVKEVYRFAVGDMNAKVSAAGSATGELNVSEEGYVDNQLASFFVGYGPGATGLVHVAGGTVSSCSEYNSSRYNSHANYPNQKFWYTNHVFVVGMLGGWGEWTQTGGSMNSYHRVYIGGCDTNELVVYKQYRDTHKDGVQPNSYPVEFATDKWGGNRGAVGKVKLSGGSWVCRNECHVGMDGNGELEIGPTGSFKAKTLFLDANAANPNAATLKFTFGADGVGSVEATNLVIAAGSKLKVDLSNYTNIHPGNVLVKANSIQGAFAAGDVEITGNEGRGRLQAAYVDQTPYGLRLCVPSGTMLYFR